MTIVGLLFDRDCDHCNVTTLGEALDDLGDIVRVQLLCCKRVEEVPAADFNELLVDCD